MEKTRSKTSIFYTYFYYIIYYFFVFIGSYAAWTWAVSTLTLGRDDPINKHDRESKCFCLNSRVAAFPQSASKFLLWPSSISDEGFQFSSTPSDQWLLCQETFFPPSLPSFPPSFPLLDTRSANQQIHFPPTNQLSYSLNTGLSGAERENGTQIHKGCDSLLARQPVCCRTSVFFSASAFSCCQHVCY